MASFYGNCATCGGTLRYAMTDTAVDINGFRQVVNGRSCDPCLERAEEAKAAKAEVKGPVKKEDKE